MLTAVPLRPRIVSFKDMRGIRQSTQVESLYEAADLGIRRLNEDPWLEKIGSATILDVEVKNSGTRHALPRQRAERWLAGATTNPNEASKNVTLKMLLIGASVDLRSEWDGYRSIDPSPPKRAGG